jgi:hypothetical protein
MFSFTDGGALAIYGLTTVADLFTNTKTMYNVGLKQPHGLAFRPLLQCPTSLVASSLYQLLFSLLQ